MVDVDSNDIPDGISIARNLSSCVTYVGDDAAFLATDFLDAACIDGVGPLIRRVVRLKEGGFRIVSEEGKAGPFSNADRDAGAMTIKRLSSGKLSVTKYRTKAEEKAIDIERRENFRRELEQEAWQHGKVARLSDDYVGRWRNSLRQHIKEIADLCAGRITYRDFPTIKVREHDVSRIVGLVDEMLNALSESEISIADLVKEEKSNVIHLNGNAYQHMAKRDTGCH